MWGQGGPVNCTYSCKPLKCAGAASHGEVAQSVERRTENPGVPGSIPGLATIHVGDSMNTTILLIAIITLVAVPVILLLLMRKK